jgi:AcrR family transcriptional regulator
MQKLEMPPISVPVRARGAAAARALHKGQQTKAAIVEAALGLATQIGLEGLSIGALAEVTQMSKSGVFAHFGSREELQISVIREYHTRFEDEVFYPALREPRGLPRLRALFANWMKRTSVEIDSGCIYISGAVEFDDRPGPVRDALASSVGVWHAAMERAIVSARDEGHLRADLDEQQMLFEIHGLILALHYSARFLKQPGAIARANAGFDNILQRYGAEAEPQPAPPRALSKSSNLAYRSTKPTKESS